MQHIYPVSNRHIDRFTAFAGFRLICGFSTLAPIFVRSFARAALAFGRRSYGIGQNRPSPRLGCRGWHHRLLARILRGNRCGRGRVKRRYLHNAPLLRIGRKNKVNKNFSYFGEEPDKPFMMLGRAKNRVIFLRLCWLTPWLRKAP